MTNTEQLLEQYNGLITYHMKKNFSWVKSWDACADDIKQEGIIALWRAIEEYDESKGVPFTPYASICVYRAMRNFAYQELKHRQCGSYDYENLNIDYFDFQSLTTSDTQFNVYIQDFLSTLTKRELEVVQLRIAGYNNREIGDKLSISRERVRQLLKSSKAKYETTAFTY